MVGWLHFAGGYRHLRYWPMQWQPVPFDRGIRVSVSKLDWPAPAENVGAADPQR